MKAAWSSPRRVVITGASSGLGRGLALSYAAAGISLGLIGRDGRRLEAVAEECRSKGAEATTAAIDVGEAEPMRAWLEALDAAAPIELIIANAGTSSGPADERSLDGTAAASLQVRTNLLGAIHTIEPAAAAMIARGAGQIALIASTAAYRGLPYMPAYAASKAGVRIYGESLRGRLAPFGVAVSVVIPSFFDSAMTDRFHGDKPLMLSTEAAVAQVRRGLDRRAGRIVFPRRIGLLMQVLDLIPAGIGDRLLGGARVRIDPP